MEVFRATARTAGTAALNYAKAHPYKITAAVAGAGLSPILGPGWMIAMPLNALGFGSTGVIGGSVAAWCQGTVYGGYVPAGSLFSLMQHFGAVL